MIYRAAKACNVAPWEMEDREDFWAEWALTFESAEAKAQEKMQKQQSRKPGRRGR